MFKDKDRFVYKVVFSGKNDLLEISIAAGLPLLIFKTSFFNLERVYVSKNCSIFFINHSFDKIDRDSTKNVIN